MNPYASEPRTLAAILEVSRMSNQSHHHDDIARKPAWRILRPWHKIRAWFLSLRIRRQHQELTKYVRRSAYEISAWKQDISFLDRQLDRQLTMAGVSQSFEPSGDKVISMEESGLITPVTALSVVQ